MSDWANIFGSIDLQSFDKMQKEELLKGMSEGIPYQLYADPNMTALEMKEMRSLLMRSSIALAGPTQALRAGMHPGFISYSIYKSKPSEVCYIPENWDPEVQGLGYTAKDILSLCDNDQDKADMVFGLCDWQDPSTILNEWDQDDDRALLERKREKLETLQREIAKLEENLSVNTQLDHIIENASKKHVRHSLDSTHYMAEDNQVKKNEKQFKTGVKEI